MGIRELGHALGHPVLLSTLLCHRDSVIVIFADSMTVGFLRDRWRLVRIDPAFILIH